MSMLLGNIFEGILTFLTNILIWFVTILIDGIVALLGELVLKLVLEVLYFVDFFQSLFKRMVGLETVWVGNNASQNDIVLALITSSEVMDVFLAVSIISVVIMLIGTLIQIIRSEYTTEGSKNSKGAIFKQSLKSIAMFVIVPVSVILGIILSQFLLQALDAATSVQGTSKISSSVFSAACLNANKCIAESKSTNKQITIEIDGKNVKFNYKHKIGEEGQIYLGYKTSPAGPVISLQSAPEVTGTDEGAVDYKKNMAELINKCFTGSYYIVVGDDANDLNSTDKIELDKEGLAYKFAVAAGLNVEMDSSGKYILGTEKNGRYELDIFDVTNGKLAVQFYNTKHINYVILCAGTFVCMYIMLMSGMGIVMRMFKATLMYLIVPAFVGLMPLDGGSSFQYWRKKFISFIFGAYGVIVSLNIFFVILPFIQNLKLFNTANAIPGISLDFQNSLMQLLLVCVGLISVKDGSKFIANLVGGEDIMAPGEKMLKQVGSAVATAAAVAATGGAAAAGLAAKGAALAAKAGAKMTEKAMTKGGKKLSERAVKNLGRTRDLAARADKFSANRKESVKKRTAGFGERMAKGVGINTEPFKNGPGKAIRAKKKEAKAEKKQEKFDAQQKQYRDITKRDIDIKNDYMKGKDDAIKSARTDLSIARKEGNKDAIEEAKDRLGKAKTAKSNAKADYEKDKAQHEWNDLGNVVGHNANIKLHEQMEKYSDKKSKIKNNEKMSEDKKEKKLSKLKDKAGKHLARYNEDKGFSKQMSKHYAGGSARYMAHAKKPKE